jgi:branched-chain amino acid transport system ATP-binding protein
VTRAPAPRAPGKRLAVRRRSELDPRLTGNVHRGTQRGRLAGTLSGGQQQMLAIGRALMARPVLMLLDEPSMGLSPKLVEVIGSTLQRLRADGLSLLLVEQNAMLTFEATSHCLVLENGEIALTGTSAELRGNPRIRRLYLGL